MIDSNPDMFNSEQYASLKPKIELPEPEWFDELADRRLQTNSSDCIKQEYNKEFDITLQNKINDFRADEIFKHFTEQFNKA